MIDTICIRIDSEKKFTVSSKAQFVPEFSIRSFSELSLAERTRANKRIPYLRHFVLHPDLPEGSPRIPQVEIFESVGQQLGLVSYELKITCSLTMLMFENNLEELDLSDPNQRRKVIGTLSERLRDVGIKIDTWNLDGAPLSVLHIAKNIQLPKTISLRQILGELSRIDMGKAYDVSESKDSPRIKNRNDGQVVNIRSGTREWVFYDKVADILRTKNKSVDKRKSESAKELIATHDLENTEVFRFEYRLNKAQTIRSEVNKILKRDYKTPVIFSDIFSKELCRTILTDAWSKIFSKPENKLTLFASHNKLDLLIHVLKKAHGKDKSAHSQNQALWSYGLACAIKENGAKTVRDEIKKVWSTKAGERLEEKVAVAAELIEKLPFSNDIMFVSEKLAQCERYVPRNDILS